MAKLKSGFEKLMEENARIAAGENNEKKSSEEILDPIGAHAKKDGAADPYPSGDAGEIGAEPVSLSMAHGLEGDGTKSADALEPVPQAPENGSAMDRKAAEVAGELAQIGPKKKTVSKGKKK